MVAQTFIDSRDKTAMLIDRLEEQTGHLSTQQREMSAVSESLAAASEEIVRVVLSDAGYGDRESQTKGDKAPDQLVNQTVEVADCRRGGRPGHTKQGRHRHEAVGRGDSFPRSQSSPVQGEDITRIVEVIKGIAATRRTCSR